MLFNSNTTLLVALIAVYFEQGNLLLNGDNKEIPLALTGIFFPTANSLTGENYFHLFPEQQKWFLSEKLFYFIDAENNLDRFLNFAFFFCSTFPITSFFYSIHFLSIDYINHYASFIRQRCLENTVEYRFKYYLHYIRALRLTPQDVVIFNNNNTNILSYSFNVKSVTLSFISYNLYFANCLSNDLPLLSENKKMLLQEEIDALLMFNLFSYDFYNSNLLFYSLSFFKLHSVNIADKVNDWFCNFLSFFSLKYKLVDKGLFFLFAFIFYDLNNHRARNLMLEKLLAFLNAKKNQSPFKRCHI